MLSSDLTAIVFSNLVWFLLTLCLGSVLVTRPSRPERAWQSRVNAAETRQAFWSGVALASPRTGRLCRSSAHRHDCAAFGSRGALGRSQNGRSLASTGAAVAETEPLTFLVSPADPNPPGAELPVGEEFGAGEVFRVSDYLVLSDYPVVGEELAAGDEFVADGVVAVSGETIARDPAGALAGERLAPLPLVDWSTGTLPPRRSLVWPGPLPRLVSAGQVSRAFNG